MRQCPTPLLAAALALVAFSGCSYARANHLFSEDPELRHVSLAARGMRAKQPAAISMVYGEAAGWGECDGVARQALRDLLEESRAMGGSRVVEVQFRNRFHWTGRPVCRRTFWRKSVLVRGFAVP